MAHLYLHAKAYYKYKRLQNLAHKVLITLNVVEGFEYLRNPVYMFLQELDRYENCRLTHLPAAESRFTEIKNSVNGNLKCLLIGLWKRFFVM